MSDQAASPIRWDVPSIAGAGSQGPLTAGRLEALQKEAYEEAWQKGHADGVEAGTQAINERVERLDELLIALSRPFDQLDETVEKQLVELSMAVVRQLFRREIRIDPTHIVGVVREAIQLLPIASRQVKLHLHPEDAAIVREALTPVDGEHQWAIIEDTLMTRGGCNVTTENSQVDATAESRLQSVISSIAGDERT